MRYRKPLDDRKIADQFERILLCAARPPDADLLDVFIVRIAGQYENGLVATPIARLTILRSLPGFLRDCEFFVVLETKRWAPK